jgi:hypothetical protein
MTGPNQSQKETAELSLPPPGRPPDPKIKPRDAARIQLPAPVAAASDSSDLRKETLAVSDMPDSPAAELKTTEPLIAMPDVTAQDPSIAAAPAGKNSMLLMWILLGASALILIIQIWTYFS